MDSLHLADCLRANKATMAWGLEARVPFLDRSFLDLAMSIDPQTKTFTHPPTVDDAGRPHIEKVIPLRKDFRGKKLMRKTVPAPKSL